MHSVHIHARARTRTSRKKSVVKCVAGKCNLDVRQPVETSGFHQRNLDLVSSPEVQFAFSITPSNRSWRGRRCTARTKKIKKINENKKSHFESESLPLGHHSDAGASTWPDDL